MTFLLAFKKVRKTVKKTKCNLWSKYVMRPLGNLLAVPFVYFNFNPNLITIFRFILEIAGITLFFNRYFIFGLFLIFLSRIFDAVDGNVARALNKRSAWGRFIDESFDMIAKIIFWMAVSFLLFENYIFGKNLIIYSYLALSVPIFELLVFHIRDRINIYTFEAGKKSGKETRELEEELKKRADFSFSSVSVYKTLIFLKFFSNLILIFWLSVYFPFLVFCVIFDMLYLFAFFALFFWFFIFISEFSRKFFYNKIILEKYPL